MTTEKTLQEFIDDHGLTMSAEWTGRNPHMENSDQMDHWKCRIRSKKTGRSMTLVFSMGVGHHGMQPGLDEVLNCLASDSTAIDQSFEDWCSELGYDQDSRRAEKTYNVCLKQAEKLERVLGHRGSLNQLMYETERL